MYHQNSMRFLHNVAYDEFYGAISNDENAECDRIAQTLGDKVNNKIVAFKGTNDKQNHATD